jgi:predicted RNA-binding protein with PIN domain
VSEPVEPLESSRPEEEVTAPSDSPVHLPSPLPEAVRARVLALAAEGVGRMPVEHLPAALRRVATFAPARRARLAGRQIAAVLESDDTFREHLATQVRAVVGELAQALTEGRPPGAADPVEVAATAYLLRPPGWVDMVAAAGSLVSAESAPGPRHTEEQLERLRRQVADLQDQVQGQRARTKEQVERLKGENVDLRRKLGETRARLREAEAAAVTATAASATRLEALERSTAAGEAEARRLRARIAELESDLAGARRAERAQKAGESVRARLLVDTLVAAAQGLQRELGLPAVDRLPADTVEAHTAEEGARASTGRASLPVHDPALLEELLLVPRAHLVIDGYNVTKFAWPDSSLERQRDRLINGAAALLARTGAEITVVFDAAETRNRPLVAPPRGVRVRFSPYGVIADDVIRDLVAAEPPGRAVVVASSDQAVARDVRAAGFKVVESGALAALLGRG